MSYEIRNMSYELRDTRYKITPAPADVGTEQPSTVVQYDSTVQACTVH
jgi:SRSO17 transposase